MLPTSVLTVSVQPSTSTNSSSLNGREMTRGESIIMPIAISTDETTRSMIKNGMNSMAPIWNAVFSSDSTNAASLTGKLCCCGGWAVDSPARRATCASDALLVWASMKRETGCSAIRSAVSRPILSWS